MNIVTASHYAERIAADCSAINWLNSIRNSDDAQHAAVYLTEQAERQLVLLAEALGYRVEKITEQKDAA